MSDQFARTALLLGKENMQRLSESKVAVFGIGGVGGHCVEALARSGIGQLDLFDKDTICLSNINRQIIATHKTVGQSKVAAMKQRILEIHPAAVVHAYPIFYMPDTAEQYPLDGYDYIVDAVDTVTAKLELISRANACGVPIISCMGAGNKMQAWAFEVADIYETSVCPMARIMRGELRKRGISALKVVYSKEPAREPIVEEQSSMLSEAPDAHQSRKPVPASNAFVPAVAGLIMAGEVIGDLVRIPPYESGQNS